MCDRRAGALAAEGLAGGGRDWRWREEPCVVPLPEESGQGKKKIEGKKKGRKGEVKCFLCLKFFSFPLFNLLWKKKIFLFFGKCW